MMVTLGKAGIKTLEDFAGCASDDLIGWNERKNGETKRFPGYIETFGLSKADAEGMVLAARRKAGWISAEEEEAVDETAEELAEEVAG
jgi:N utilization substance protein A